MIKSNQILLYVLSYASIFNYLEVFKVARVNTSLGIWFVLRFNSLLNYRVIKSCLNNVYNFFTWQSSIRFCTYINCWLELNSNLRLNNKSHTLRVCQPKFWRYWPKKFFDGQVNVFIPENNIEQMKYGIVFAHNASDIIFITFFRVLLSNLKNVWRGLDM